MVTDDRYQLRSTLVTNANAHERARAAAALAKLRWGAEWLRSAARDDAPLVREASIAGLARVADSDSETILRHALLHDQVWWVRRTAAAALATIAGPGATAALVEALADPFWRVRHAAVRALAVLGEAKPGVRRAVLAGEYRDPNRCAAIEYLRRGWSGVDGPVLRPQPSSYGDSNSLYDDDPAVMAARLEDPARQVSGPVLVELLADPHEQLRTLAAQRLLEHDDVSLLRAATVWLEEPRVPYAMATATALLDRLGERARHIACELVDDAGAHWRPVCWALSWFARARDASSIAAVRGRCSDDNAWVRAAAVTAMRAIDRSPQTAVYCLSLIADEHADVREACIDAVADSDVAPRVLELIDPSQQTAAARLALVRIAASCEHDAFLIQMATMGDVRTRAIASRALARRNALPAALARRYGQDADPWLRAAAIDSAVRAQAALRDSDAQVRREGLVWLRRNGDGAAAASLVTDPVIAVRRRAGSMATAQLEARLQQTLEQVATRPPAAANRVQPRRGRPAQEQPPVAPSLRALGASGVLVPPLIVSGAHNLVAPGYRHALRQGANAFFWEPRYLQLGQFIAGERGRRQGLTVIAGSYEASARQITRDVDRALRRLRTDYLDVFLLFWVRSARRVDDDAFACMQKLKASGKVRAVGFSTHHRDIAVDAMNSHAWDTIMIRHSAAHTGAQNAVFPTAVARDVGVLAFSATSYGRLLRGDGAPTAADCYRYCLSQPGVSAVVSAPRYRRELDHNLEVVTDYELPDDRRAALHAHGARVYAQSKDFAALVRRTPTEIPERSTRRLRSLLADVTDEPRGR